MKEQLLAAAEKSGCRDRDAFIRAMDDALGSGRSAVDDALDSGLIDENRFLEALSQELGLTWHPHVRPDSADSPDLKKACGAQLGVRHRMVPLRFLPNQSEDESAAPKIELITYDPFSLHQRQAARLGVAHPIRWSIAPRRLIIEAIQEFYGVGADTFEEILQGRETDPHSADLREEINVLDDEDEEASVVKFVNLIAREALNQRATDIHVEPLEDDLRIRYRIDGVLRSAPVPENIKALQDSVIARLKVMARLDIAEKRRPQDGRISLQLDGRAIDVRVATIPTAVGESISLRLLGQERFTIGRLQFTPELETQIRDLLQHPNGIVLVTGPTGSGKSTTLYSFLSELNAESRRIVTIEDPVENKLDGVLQIPVNPDIDVTFAAGLRSILRGDPNVIMVGEIRDLETAEIAIRAALTGHLVFSTLHTNNSIGGITRLVDMGLEPFLVASSVRAFMAQRLVRRLCEECRIRGGIPAQALASLGISASEGESVFQVNPKGCETCRYTGFHGRIAIYELCHVTEKLGEMIVSGASIQELRNQARIDGFHTMREYGRQKVLEGLTTIDEVCLATAGE